MIPCKDIFEKNVECCESKSGSQGVFLVCNVKIIVFVIKSVVDSDVVEKGAQRRSRHSSFYILKGTFP